MIARFVSAVSFALLFASASFAEGAGVTAGTASVNAQQPEKSASEALPLHASASLTHSLGTGSFIVSGYADPTVQSLAVLSGSAKINDAWSASAMMRVAFEWTDSDSDTYNHQVDLFDPRFALSYKALTMKDLGLDAVVSGGYWLPISMASRAVGSTGVFTLGGKIGYAPPAVTGLSTYGTVGVGYSYNDAGLRSAYAAAASAKSFVATNGQTEIPLTCVEGVRGGANGGDAANGACASAGKGFRWNVGAGASYSFLDDQLTASLDITYLQSFGSYEPSNTGVDNLGYNNADLSSKNALGAYDLAQGQVTIGSIGLSYQPVKWFTLTGGLYTFQPVITPGPNGNVVRWFPLWDLYSIPGIGTSGVNNFSSLFIDTTFSI